MLNSPFQMVGDLTSGTVCGNPQRLGRGVVASGNMIGGAVIGGLKSPVTTAGEMEIQIVGFQGAGGRFLAELEDAHPLTYAGHVGISFDGGGTIYGFTPHTPGMLGSEALRRLKQHEIFPGHVGDDTAVFKHAYSYAQQLTQDGRLPNPPRLEIYVWRQKVSQAEFYRLQEAVLDEAAKGPLSDKPYGFPPKESTIVCNNCATWPRTLGIEIPEPTGQLTNYIVKLIQRGGGELWIPHD